MIAIEHFRFCETTFEAALEHISSGDLKATEEVRHTLQLNLLFNSICFLFQHNTIIQFTYTSVEKNDMPEAYCL